MGRKNNTRKERGYLCPDTDATYSWFVQAGTNAVYAELTLRDCSRAITLSFDAFPTHKKITRKNLRKETKESIAKLRLLRRQMEIMEREILKAEKKVAAGLKGDV